MNDDKQTSSISEKSTPEIEQKLLREGTGIIQSAEDVEAATSLSTERQTDEMQGTLSKMYSELKSYICTSEDDINLQCDMSNDLELDREPMFVIVDSSCLSEPSSKEIIINEITRDKPTVLNKYLNKNILYSDMPSTSHDNKKELNTSTMKGSVSREEVQMIDINLQSENDITVEKNENDNESIVLAYLKNKDIHIDIDGTFKKKSSLLESVPKMETIPEELSDTYLDVHIPSYPGSPRSLKGQSSNLTENVVGAIYLVEKDSEFLEAAELGDDISLERFISQQIDIQQVDHIGRNALHLAVASENLKCVQILLKAGVNPNVKDNVGNTPLSVCLLRRATLPMVSALLEHGAILYPRNNTMSPGLFLQFIMMSIPTNEEMLIIELLIQHGGEINDPDAPGGRQALHFAAMSNNCTLIELLVQLGADLYEINDRLETAKEVAIKYKCLNAEILLEHLEDTFSIDSFD